MIRRTFLTLIGAVAWPWRKKADSEFAFSGGQITSIRRLSSHGFYIYNISGRRIEAGTLVKLVGNNGVIPCNDATS